MIGEMMRLIPALHAQGVLVEIARGRATTEPAALSWAPIGERAQPPIAGARLGGGPGARISIREI
jgi:hypothetical protein